MTSPQPPKICRYCGAPILWGLKPDGKIGPHRPLDAMSGRPSYMVFGDCVYYGLAYDPHICTAEEIKAWDMKYERMKDRQYPTNNETVAPPEAKPIREISPRTPKKYRKAKVDKKGEPTEIVVVSEFEKQAKMYLDSLAEVNQEEFTTIIASDSEIVDLDTTAQQIGHDSYRRRRDANRWMHALKVDCPKCEKRKGSLCISMNKYQKDHVIKVAHDERIKFADETFGKLYEEN
jgi:hypothetical protein